MKNYLDDINNQFPIRRSDSEKEEFRNYVMNDVAASGHSACVETHKKHHNIVIGDIDEAKVIYTAHYDTPATSIIPNLMLPKNKYLSTIYHCALPAILSILSYLIGYVAAVFMTETPSAETALSLLIWLGLYLSSFYFMTRYFKNRHNKNDNTSGVATVLSLVHRCASKEVAFVLFDNEEKGLLGSKAFKEIHKEILKDKLMINFDCVGVGSNILLIAKEGAENHRLYSSLVENMKSDEDFNVMFYPFGKTASNSDYKVFDCGIGVMACKKKNGIFYTTKIHTNKDTEAYAENVDFLVNNMVHFVNEAFREAVISKI